MERMTVNKFNYEEVADQVAGMLKEDKDAKIELVCGDKIYYPRACRQKVGDTLILALEEVKNGFVPYDRGYDLKGENYERICVRDCPEYDLKYFPILLRVAVSDVPEDFKFYYMNILLAEAGLEYTKKPYYEGLWKFNTPRKGWEMIDRFEYNKEKGGFDFDFFLQRMNGPLIEEPAFETSVTGFPRTADGIEMALLETIDIFETKVAELK